MSDIDRSGFEVIDNTPPVAAEGSEGVNWDFFRREGEEETVASADTADVDWDFFSPAPAEDEAPREVVEFSGGTSMVLDPVAQAQPQPAADPLGPPPEDSGGVIDTVADIGLAGGKGVVSMAGDVAGLLADVGSLGGNVHRPAWMTDEEASGYGLDKAPPGIDPGQAIRDSAKRGKEWLSSLQSEAGQYSDKKVAAEIAALGEEGFMVQLFGSVGIYAQNPRALINGIAESVPAMIPSTSAVRVVAGTMLVAKGLVPGTKAAAAYLASKPVMAKLATVAAAGEGAVSGLSNYSTARDAGKGVGESAGIGAATGVGTAVIGRVASKFLPDVEAELGRALAGGKAGAGSAGKSALNVGRGMISEGAFQELPQSMQEQVWANIAEDKPWDEGLGSAGGSGFIMGAGMGGMAQTGAELMSVPGGIAEARSVQNETPSQATPVVPGVSARLDDGFGTVDDVTVLEEISDTTVRIRRSDGTEQLAGKALLTPTSPAPAPGPDITADPFSDALAGQNAARQAEIDAIMGTDPLPDTGTSDLTAQLAAVPTPPTFQVSPENQAATPQLGARTRGADGNPIGDTPAQRAVNERRRATASAFTQAERDAESRRAADEADFEFQTIREEALARREQEAEKGPVTIREAAARIRARKEAEKAAAAPEADTGVNAPVNPAMAEALKAAKEKRAQTDTAPDFSPQQGEAPIFKTKLEGLVNERLGKQVPAAQLSQMIKAWTKKGEVKPEEVDTLKIQEWADSQEGKVTKQQVLDFISENTPAMGESLKGESEQDHPIEALRKRYVQDMASHYSLEFDPGTNRWEVIDEHPTYGAMVVASMTEEEAAAYGDTADADAFVRSFLDEEASDLGRESLADALGDDGGYPTKYPSYTQPGGEDYKELLITRGGKVIEDYTSSHWEEKNVLAHVRFDTREQDGKKTLFIEEVQSDMHQEGRKKGYKGEPIQYGSKVSGYVPEGYSFEKTTRPGVGYVIHQLVDPNGKVVGEGTDRIEALEKSGMDPSVPGGAPFKKSWPMLAMKRMIRYAAENGFDRISWATGAMNADLYSLRKVISDVQVGSRIDPSFKGGRDYSLVVELKEGGTQLHRNLDENQLEEYVGKDLATKIVADHNNTTAIDEELAGIKAQVQEYQKGLSAKPEAEQERLRGEITNLYNRKKALTKERKQQEEIETNYQGLDLEQGGEGMSAFYDKILPNEVKKYAKKYGVKVEAKPLEIPKTPRDKNERYTYMRTDDGYLILDPEGYTEEFLAPDATMPEVRARLAELNRTIGGEPDVKDVLGFDMTDALKEEALAGQPMFSPKQKALGEFKFVERADGTIIVRGDPEAIRAALPSDVKGRAVKGGVKFGHNAAPRVKGALTGQAVAYSRQGEVLRRKPQKDGKYLGAPPQYNTSRKLPKLREILRNLTTEGAAGRFWYENSSREVLRLTGGDVKEARKLVALLAIYSPQAKVDANTTFAIRAWAQYKAGQPISVKTESQDKKAQEALDDVEAFWSGQKTGNFFFNLLSVIDPSTSGKQGATIDMWMMRAAHYDHDAPTDLEYAFMEDETNRIAQELGWEPQQVQAAIWVAMKARMENKDVKKATEDSSYEKGWITYKDVKQIKRRDGTVEEKRTNRVVLDEKKHFNNWIEHALAHDVTAADTNQAKFDFGDGLERHVGQVSWEPRPSTAVSEMSGIHSASYEEQLEYFQAIQKVLYDENGVDRLAAELGLLSNASTQLPGVWEGDVSPSGQNEIVMAPAAAGVMYEKGSSQLTKKEWEAQGKPEGYTRRTALDPAQKELLDVYADVLGLILKQDGVGYHRAFKAINRSVANGVELRSGSAFTPVETAAFEKALAAELGKHNVPAAQAAIISTPEGVRVINFSEVENMTFHKIVEAAAGDAAVPDTELGIFTSDGDLRSNDWRTNANGESYQNRIAASSRPDVLGWARTVLAPDIQKTSQEFAAKFGWGQPVSVNFSPAIGEEAGADVREGAESPSYGTATEGSVSVQATHYSREARTELDSSQYGSGRPGAERGRLSQPDADPAVRNRIFFYVDEGNGVDPEIGVGQTPHNVTLENLYPAREDPLGLREKAAALFPDGNYDARANFFESEVVKAGFDGLYDLGAFGNQGVAVLLGNHRVPVAATQASKPAETTSGETLADALEASKLPGGRMRASAWATKIVGTEFDTPANQAALAALGGELLYRRDLAGVFSTETKPKRMSDEQTRNAKVDALRTKLGWPPGSISQTAPGDRLLVQAVRAVSRVLGIEVIFVDTPAAEHTFNGVVNPSDPKTLFLNVKGDAPMLSIIGHEFIHTLATTNRPKFAQVGAALLKANGVSKADVAAYKKWVNDKRAQLGQPPIDDVKAMEEMIADFSGTTWNSPDFWTALADDNPSAFRLVANGFINLVNKLISGIKSNQALQGSKYMRDVKATREILGNMLAEMGEDVPAVGKPGDPDFLPAYHGTGGTVDKFSTSKIGTGEGNAAFGWGLYYASKKEVGEFYRNKLAKKAGTKGNLYTVELAPTSEELLKWDSALNNQPAAVKRALGSLNLSVFSVEENGTEVATYTDRRKAKRAYPNANIVEMPPRSGGVAYRMLERQFGEPTRQTALRLEAMGLDPEGDLSGFSNDQLASMYLHTLGVRGVQFLDSSSRARGEGGTNYVVFNDADVEITAVNEADTLDNIDEFTLPDFSPRQKPEPEKTITAYKMFRAKGGKLYPLFISADEETPVGEWLDADIGDNEKSKIGKLALRPGWHMGDTPSATHIGGGRGEDGKPSFRRPDQVWAEVKVAADRDWQTEANKRARTYKSGPRKGEIVPSSAEIKGEIPEDGYYRYKTNPNMQGEWIIGGSIKIERILTDEEVAAINEEAGTPDLPRQKPLDLEKLGFDSAPAAKDGRAFRDFFSKVVTGASGKSDTGVAYEPVIQGRDDLRDFAVEYGKHRGNFDDHIAYSIPGFKEVQMAVGNAIVKSYGKNAKMLDIGASEGSIGKTVTSLGGPKTVSMDPNPDMAESFKTHSTVPGATYEMSAFTYADQVGEELWTEGDTPIYGYDPKGELFDVVHEAMVFQFIENDRSNQIPRVKEFMKPGGVAIFEEKVHNGQWKQNEAKKDANKRKYFQPKDMNEKAKAVLEGMNENMDQQESLEATLAENFAHVVQFWDSGNFKGYMASDSLAALDRLVDNVGDLNSEYSTVQTPRAVTGDVDFSPTQSEAFQTWFGDSKIVNEAGDPMVMYHGTTDEIKAFDKDKIRADDYDSPVNGFWFSSDPSTSPAMRDATNVMPVYLSIKNPAPAKVWRSIRGKVWKDSKTREAARSFSDEARYRLQDQGYDGYLFEVPVKVDREAFARDGEITITDDAGRTRTLKREQRPEVVLKDITGHYNEVEILIDGKVVGSSPMNSTGVLSILADNKDAVSHMDESVLSAVVSVTSGEVKQDKAGNVTLRNVAKTYTDKQLTKTGNMVDVVAMYTESVGHVIDYESVEDFESFHDTTVAVAFEPNQIKSAVGNRGTFDATQDDVAFMPTQAATTLDELGPLSFKTKFLSAIYDKYQALIEAQKAVSEKYGVVSEDQDVNLALTVYPGRARARLDEFKETYIEPLKVAIDESGMTQEEIGEFLLARHAREANAVLKERSPDRTNNESLSGMSDADADAVLARYRGDANAQRLGTLIDSINLSRVNLMVRDGLMTQEEADKWGQLYSHYVPLHREDMGEAMPGSGSGFDVGHAKPSKLRVGSSTKSVDVKHIVARVLAQYEATISRSEKNEVAKAFYRMAKNNPAENLWVADEVPSSPFLKSDGTADFRENNMARNVITARIDGEPKHVMINDGNPFGEKILKSMGYLDAEGNKLLKPLLFLNRYLASINTSLSPEFVISNLIRDWQTAAYNLTDTELKDLKAKVLFRVGSAIKGIHNALRGSNNTEWARYYRRFEKAGGMTGWTQSYDGLGGRLKALEREMKYGDMAGVKQVTAMFDTIADYNTMIENGVRLSAFRAAVDMGMSDKKAAALAKELTVNFNRRGDFGLALNALYLFAKASINGSGRILIAAMNPKNKTLHKMLAATVVFATVMEIVNRAMDDDDIYEQIPDTIKDRNLVIIDPFGIAEDGYFKIPLPWGYNVFHVLGQEIGKGIMFAAGEYPSWSAGDAAARTALSLLHAFNPIQDGTVIQTLSPTIVDPIARVAENKNWHGGALLPDYNKHQADYKKYFRSAREESVAMAKWMHDVTLDPETRKAIMDVSPATLDMAYDFFTGAVGRVISDSASLAKVVVTGEEIPEVRKLPMVRRVYGNVSEGDRQRQFYDRFDEMLYVEQSLKDADVSERKDIMHGLGSRKELLGPAKMAKKQLTRLSKQRRAAELHGDKARVKAIEKKRLEVMTRFTAKYNKVVHGI